MLRRAPFTLVAVLAVVLGLWWSQSGDGANPLPWSSDTVETAAPDDGDRGPTTIGPAQESSPGGAQQGPPGEAGDLPSVRLVDLPPEAVEVVTLIDAGGPFAHPDKDGSRFGNHEGLLPARPRGHYREYTVPTPGLDHRGARRIVTGGPGEMYWTDDHYQSFARLVR